MKAFKITILCILSVLVLTVVVFGLLILVSIVNIDKGEDSPTNEAAYKEVFKNNDVFQNDFDGLLPQTVIHKTVMEHFKNENGLDKKAVIIGWDGARADAMLKIADEDGGIKTLRANGGKSYLLYTGNEAGNKILQDTSTAPGWATVLTGEWATKSLVFSNYTPKFFKDTFLKSLAEEGQKTSFNYLWTYHSFTYALEKYVLKEKDQTFNFIENKDNSDLVTMENRLKDAVIADIDNDKDVIFSIFESPDTIGHMNEFSPDNEKYMIGMRNINGYAKEIIEHIYSRDTYEKEDWLIIIVPDHGGILANHGSQTIECRTIFAVSNKSLAS